MPARLETFWFADALGVSHMFGSTRPGVRSLCGEERLLREKREATTVRCYFCAAQYRFLTAVGGNSSTVYV